MTDDIKGETPNSGARNSALSRFESSKRRFFGQLLISMKLPSVIAKIKFEIEAGDAIVLKLVTTAEAMLGRRLADLSPEERANLDIELSPRSTSSTISGTPSPHVRCGFSPTSRAMRVPSR